MEKVDVLVVGAGFAGLRVLQTFRGLGKRVVLIEASDAIGGVWHHNGYPGARCDVDYSYRFSPELEQEWRWSERYATQPEILRYIEHVADRFELRKDIRLNARMASAAFDEAGHRWRITTTDGRQWAAQILVLCMGQPFQGYQPIRAGTATQDASSTARNGRAERSTSPASASASSALAPRACR